ncbi:MAG: YraN family protein [Nocardioidaceae bacterium]
MASTHAQRKALGDYGEQIAADYLTAEGMVILERNYRCPVGEIDIVARDGDTLVICEVKTRRDLSHGTPLEAVTTHKARRLRRLAGHWLDDRDLHVPGVRIDVVAVLVPTRGRARVERVAGVS